MLLTVKSRGHTNRGVHQNLLYYSIVPFEICLVFLVGTAILTTFYVFFFSFLSVRNQYGTSSFWVFFYVLHYISTTSL